MKKTLFVISFLVSLMSQPAFSAAKYGVFQPSTVSGKVVLVRWDSEEGQKRLFRTAYKNDFFQLTQYYQPQINPLYCGVASSVIVLNALRKPNEEVPSQKALEVQLPKALGSRVAAYTLYSQQTFLNDRTEKVKPRKVVELKNATPKNENDPKSFDPGFTLAQLKGALEAYDTKVSLQYADQEVEKGSRAFRETVKKVLKDSNRYLIINFRRGIFGDQTSTNGHLSPVAAYDEETDSVLVLDVAGHKLPWFWVPVGELYQAMNTKDGDRYRGYLVVSD